MFFIFIFIFSLLSRAFKVKTNKYGKNVINYIKFIYKIKNKIQTK